MGVYTHSSGNWFSRRGAFLGYLIAFHLLLFWALKSGFAVKFIESITEPIKAEIINEPKIEEPPPPPPEVRIEQPKIQVPPILIDIPIPPPPQALIVETTPDKVPPAPPVPPPPAPPASTGTGRNVTGAGYAFKPDPADYYPSASRNLGEEGLAKVRVCYDVKGKPLPDGVAISEGSKFSRLDEAAIKYGKAVKVKPGTIDGKPQADCVVVPVRFSLKGEK
jgi:protein TonB